MSPKGPLHFFIFQKNGCSKTPKGPTFYIFRHYATYRRQKNRQKIRNFSFAILSLRYGADLGRSGLLISHAMILKTSMRLPPIVNILMFSSSCLEEAS